MKAIHRRNEAAQGSRVKGEDGARAGDGNGSQGLRVKTAAKERTHCPATAPPIQVKRPLARSAAGERSQFHIFFFSPESPEPRAWSMT